MANSLYDSKSLARAVEEFSSSVDIALTKKGNYTEVAISNEADVNALGRANLTWIVANASEDKLCPTGAVDALALNIVIVRKPKTYDAVM